MRSHVYPLNVFVKRRGNVSIIETLQPLHALPSFHHWLHNPATLRDSIDLNPIQLYNSILSNPIYPPQPPLPPHPHPHSSLISILPSTPFSTPFSTACPFISNPKTPLNALPNLFTPSSIASWLAAANVILKKIASPSLTSLSCLGFVSCWDFASCSAQNQLPLATRTPASKPARKTSSSRVEWLEVEG